MSMMKEFKAFALKGNVMDMAVGVIIGGAFGKIVTSLIEDVIMPVVGKVVGNVDFSNLYLPLSEASKGMATLAEAKKAGAVLAYGNFLTVVINFTILAFIIFMMVKAMNNLKKAEAAAPAAPAAPPADVLLLTEIRDLLKRK
jgi:large conductance mechanosensitive channel